MENLKDIRVDDLEVSIDAYRQSVTVYVPVSGYVLHELPVNMNDDDDVDEILESFWYIYEDDVRTSLEHYGYALVKGEV